MAAPFPHRRRAFALLPACLLVLLLLAVPLVTAACGGGPSSTTPAASTATTATGSTATTSAADATTAATSTSAAGASVTPPPEDNAPFPVTVSDDSGATVTVGNRPQRIVSTVPANTEILFALGAGSRVVGVSSMDDYPPEALSLPKVGTFELNQEAVTALDPDLVVGWTGNADALKATKDRGVPVLLFGPESVDGVYACITSIGDAVGQPAAALKLVDKIKIQIDGIGNSAADLADSPKVFYALDNTLWTVGPGSFVDELISLAGATNVAGDGPSAFYQFTPEQLVAADPDMILLPNTAFTSTAEFLEDSRFANLRAVKAGKVVLVNDTIITRPGPRLAEGLRSLAMAIHPGVDF
jgi:iron complex transport system substrate-binding protein